MLQIVLPNDPTYVCESCGEPMEPWYAKDNDFMHPACREYEQDRK